MACVIYSSSTPCSVSLSQSPSPIYLLGTPASCCTHKFAFCWLNLPSGTYPSDGCSVVLKGNFFVFWRQCWRGKEFFTSSEWSENESEQSAWKSCVCLQRVPRTSQKWPRWGRHSTAVLVCLPIADFCNSLLVSSSLSHTPAPYFFGIALLKKWPTLKSFFWGSPL